MPYRHPHTLYLPAIFIVAAVFVMLIFIGVSTYHNLDAGRRHAMMFVEREGAAMLKAVEAGARAGMLSPGFGEDAVDRLIVETGKNDGIAYLYLMNPDGRITHHSDIRMIGEASAWKPALEGRDVVSRMTATSAGLPVLDVAGRFSPPTFADRDLPAFAGRSMGPAFFESILVIGIEMATFEAARKSDLRHAGVMAGILAALAAGAAFFMLVIHRFYQINATLKKSQAYIGQVIAHMPSGLLSTDSEGRIVAHNRLSQELFGLSDAELDGRDLNTLIGEHLPDIRKAIASRQPLLDREIAHARPDGAQIPIGLSLTPIPGEGPRSQAAVVILRDLRQLKHLEDQVRKAEKLAAIGKLAAAVAHEIRHPLSSIRGFAQFLGHVLRDRPADQEYARIMVREVDRINRVVTDLLTFARPLDPLRAPADLAGLIAHIGRLTEADAAAAGVRIVRAAAPDLPPVSLDANLITQALLNLSLNAIQALESGQTIEIGAALDSSGEAVRIWVEDAGPGIPEDHRARLFDPFFTTRDKGTGLGLSIVQKIAENHQGKVLLESTPPGRASGCRFTLWITLAA